MGVLSKNYLRTQDKLRAFKLAVLYTKRLVLYLKLLEPKTEMPVIESIVRRQCIPIIYTRGTHYEVGFDVVSTHLYIFNNFFKNLTILSNLQKNSLIYLLGHTYSLIII